MNNESILKINGYITENELRKCANSLGSGSFSELDLSEARLDFDKAPAGLYYVNNGPIGLKYKKVTFPATVHGLDDNAFMGSATIEEIHFLGGLNYIGENAIVNCSNIKGIYLHDINQMIDIPRADNWDTNVDGVFAFYVQSANQYRHWLVLYIYNIQNF